MKYAAFKNRRWQKGKKTCFRNMAQCRELEKMGSVSRTNCIDRDLRKEFNKYVQAKYGHL